MCATLDKLEITCSGVGFAHGTRAPAKGVKIVYSRYGWCQAFHAENFSFLNQHWMYHYTGIFRAHSALNGEWRAERSWEVCNEEEERTFTLVVELLLACEKELKDGLIRMQFLCNFVETTIYSAISDNEDSIWVI